MRSLYCFLLFQFLFLGITACNVIETPATEDEKDIISFEQLRDLGLPLIEITTINGEDPTCEYVDHPEGATGSSITNATKVPGRCRIWFHDDCIYDSGDYQKDESGITIKIRGNTSAYPDKKPYKIRLQKKADLLFRTDPVYKDKDWVLLKGQSAFTNENEMNLNTLIGNKMNQIVNMQ